MLLFYEFILVTFSALIPFDRAEDSDAMGPLSYELINSIYSKYREALDNELKENIFRRWFGNKRNLRSKPNKDFNNQMNPDKIPRHLRDSYQKPQITHDTPEIFIVSDSEEEDDDDNARIEQDDEDKEQLKHFENPVESKLPQSQLTYDDIKKALIDRVRSQRNELKKINFQNFLRVKTNNNFHVYQKTNESIKTFVPKYKPTRTNLKLNADDKLKDIVKMEHDKLFASNPPTKKTRYTTTASIDNTEEEDKADDQVLTTTEPAKDLKRILLTGDTVRDFSFRTGMKNISAKHKISTKKLKHKIKGSALKVHATKVLPIVLHNITSNNNTSKHNMNRSAIKEHVAKVLPIVLYSNKTSTNTSKRSVRKSKTNKITTTSIPKVYTTVVESTLNQADTTIVESTTNLIDLGMPTTETNIGTDGTQSIDTTVTIEETKISLVPQNDDSIESTTPTTDIIIGTELSTESVFTDPPNDVEETTTIAQEETTNDETNNEEATKDDTNNEETIDDVTENAEESSSSTTTEKAETKMTYVRDTFGGLPMYVTLKSTSTTTRRTLGRPLVFMGGDNNN